ncbi:MAG: glycosyltransferase family 9 protein [Deltaproteobacteria bacterium]|nr:glycosyltransferase family 9 protein [Deltaproteobacteria bacterium]MBW2020263.1 glycosyltransferase family 9 protein [Deltaproteobacteria bacterium]MBW2073125.1 glycosyltransferase family 9 protein [Deltaproteobacteria bacterium]
MVKILIIQLDRLGDTLWITPLLSGLRQVKAPCQISVLVRPETADVLKGNPDIYEIITADWLNLPLEWPEMEGHGLLEFYRRMDEVVDNLRARGFDYVYNMNFKKITTILTRLVNAPQVIGFTLSHDGARLIKGPWVNYLGCLVRSRAYNLFNMADIFRCFEPEIHTKQNLVFNVPAEDRAAVTDFLARFGVGKDDLLIGFQPGASTAKRIWPPSQFARLGDRLVEEMGAKILLFGQERESGLGAAIEREMRNPVTNLIGKTSIGRLAAFLESCHCLVSNDTGPMHLAAAVGTKTVGLFFGHAHFAETAPYGKGHLVFQPNISCAPCNWKQECKEGYKCLDYVSPDGVFKILDKWLDGPYPHAAQIEDTEDMARMNIYYSSFDEFDFLTYFPLIKRSLNAEDVLRLAYKLMWLYELEGENDLEKRCKYIEKTLKHYLMDKPDKLSAQMDKILQSVSELEGLSERGLESTRELLDILMQAEIDTVRLNEIVAQLNQVDGDIDSKGTIYDALKPLTMAFSLDKQNLEGSNIYQLARETKDLYEATKLRCTVLREKLDEVMEVTHRQRFSC